MQQLQINGKWLLYGIDSTCVGSTLEEILKTKLFISGRRIQKLTRTNGLFINNRKCFLKKKLKLHDCIKLRVEENVSDKFKPVSMDLDIIYEDEWLIIINKVAGLKVYPNEKNDLKTLANGIQYYYNEKQVANGIHFVHRLDTNTTGAIMVAKNSYAHHLLDMQLKTNQIKRSYIAIATGTLENDSGIIDAPISKLNTTSNKRGVTKNGEHAITQYVTIKCNSEVSAVNVKLETGKTHQIRVHFSHIGHPLIGDRLYGGSIHPYINRQALHSYELSWFDLSNQKLTTVRAALPTDIVGILDSID